MLSSFALKLNLRRYNTGSYQYYKSRMEMCGAHDGRWWGLQRETLPRVSGGTKLSPCPS